MGLSLRPDLSGWTVDEYSGLDRLVFDSFFVAFS